MKKISDRIVEPGTKDLAINKNRTTIRGIIYKDGKLLMVYAHKFKDYTFPGGGMKANEDHLAALKRELNEELGAKTISDIKAFGYTEEKRFGIKGGDNVYLQTSYYYMVDVLEFGPQNLMEREIEHGVEPTWVLIDDAIATNHLAIQTHKHHKGMKTVLPREIKVLEAIKKEVEANKL